ncbi:unnamed protein product [Knipowitschia caucasica]|uniref:V-set and immunoglobulin domain-containing protein 10-like n=1 Tax=Knipowitschia caucasica TaxID=637954 RepID=A0AAV2M9P0_KNICA
MIQKNRGLSAALICVVLALLPQGSQALLELSASGPDVASVLVGGNVTLGVSYSRASNAAIIWRRGLDPVATWTINTSAPPDIHPGLASVLGVSANGSLQFVGVTLDYSGGYSVEMTKSGQGTATLNFTLTVYERFEGVVLTWHPDSVVEGSKRWSLGYTMVRGVVQDATWTFGDTEIQTSDRYHVDLNNLVILAPVRTDSGPYTLTLRNPYSNATARTMVTVLYGPDEPEVTASPDLPFHVSGSSLNLSCGADSFPPPLYSWTFKGEKLDDGEVLTLTNVQTSHNGEYTCSAVNGETRTSQSKNVTLRVYESPGDSPVCSVLALGDLDLQYRCSWPGGTPPAQISFPGLDNSSAPGLLTLTVAATQNLSGTSVSCSASHPVLHASCNITAAAPAPFLPSLSFGVSSEGKIRVTMSCVSAAVPVAVVSWLKGTEAVNNSQVYSLSSTELTGEDHNITTFLLHQYTCSCRNPLGEQRRQIQLRAPVISDSSLFSNRDGTVVTLTWEVPPTSIVTGFEIQMQGPDLERSQGILPGRASSFRTIQQRPGSARSTDILNLDPKLNYKFRVVPKARLINGEPSAVQHIGPGSGLSGSAIAGIAAGIPGGILLLLLPIGFLCLLKHRHHNEQVRYPMTTDKGLKTKPELSPNNIRMAGGLNNYSPDYNRLHQAPSERSMDLPMFVPPAPVRVATTV